MLPPSAAACCTRLWPVKPNFCPRKTRSYKLALVPDPKSGDRTARPIEPAKRLLTFPPPNLKACMSVREKSDRPKLQSHHGPVEIERKFLVSNDDWRRFAA